MSQITETSQEINRLVSLTKENSLYSARTIQRLPAFLEQAIAYSQIKPGYFYTDYMNEAWHGDEAIKEKFGIVKQGFGEAMYWAPQGTFKSNLSLQHLYKVYGNWEVVLRRNIMTLEQLVSLYQEARETHSYIPAVNIDDVSMVFSKQLWFEQGGMLDKAIPGLGRQVYIQLDKVIAGIRRRVSWLSFSTPYPENTIKPLARNLSYEIWVYPKPAYIVNKYIRLIDPYHEVHSNLKKIVIEHKNFDPRGVDPDAWAKYNEQREATDNMVFRPLEEIVQRKGLKVPKMKITSRKFMEVLARYGVKRDTRALYQAWKEMGEGEDDFNES